MTVYEEIRAERRRQRHGEGFGDEHDDQHTDGSLAQAAACYAGSAANHAHASDLIDKTPPPTGITHEDVVAAMGQQRWPASWLKSWDKRGEHPPRRQLVIAAALIVAEIQRLDRAERRSRA